LSTSHNAMQQTIIDFVGLHPGQFTIPRLAKVISERTEYSHDALDAEMRSMMGTDLRLSTSRTVAPGTW